MSNPYLAGLELVKIHHGTSGQAALAKCILSLYNRRNAFAMSEILAPLDERYLKVVMDMVQAYAENGETDELVSAGRYCAEQFPGLIELATAMAEARDQVWRRWDREREELARIEEEKEEAYRKERERSAITLHCAQCKADTKHYPIPGRASYECSECYEQRGA